MISLVNGGMTIRNACGRTIDTQRPARRHAQRAGRLDLALRHRLDAGPDGLRHVGRRGQPEADRDLTVEAARELEAGEGPRDAVGDQEQHEQRRQTAEQLDVGGAEPRGTTRTDDSRISAMITPTNEAEDEGAARCRSGCSSDPW